MSESAIVRSNASNTSDLTGGATSVAINGSSSESNCVIVLTTRLATFLAEKPEKNLPVPLGSASPAMCGAGSVPCVCLHPQQSTLDGCRRHLTHSCLTHWTWWWVQIVHNRLHAGTVHNCVIDAVIIPAKRGRKRMLIALVPAPAEPVKRAWM